MAEEIAPDLAPVAAAPARRRWWRWVSLSVLVAIAALLLAIWGGVRWLDSQAGHRFIIGQIARWEPVTGLRVSVGSIEGRLFRDLTLRDVRFSDPKGEFARVQRADMSWYPLGWLSNRLDIDRLHIVSADLHRLPQFRPTEAKTSILPGFDIRLADLRVDRLGLGAGIAGERRTIRAVGKADIRSGRAVINLLAFSANTPDVVRLALDSRPDDRKFDIDLVVVGPRGGIIAKLAGTDRPVAFTIRGDGDWRRWRGRALALDGKQLVVNLALGMEQGSYHVRGPLALIGPMTLLKPLAPDGRAQLDATLRFDNRLLSGTASLGLSAAQLRATGGLDLARNRFDELRLDAAIAQPGRLAPGVSGQPIQLRARLAGPFADAQLDYLLTGAELRQGSLQLRDLRLSGEGRLAGTKGSFPIRLTARSLALGNPMIDERLRNLTVNGMLTRDGDALRIAPTAVKASGLAAVLDGQANLRAGSFLANLKGGFDRLEMRGLGRLDLSAVLRLAHLPRGATTFTGTARATMRRLDNGFLRGLGEGLPVLTSNFAFAGQGRIALSNLRVAAPALTLAGNGFVDPKGNLQIAATGQHRAYGPLRVTLAGKADRPEVDLLLERPLPVLRLANVHAHLTPDERGYAVSVEGGSMLGPFKGEAAVLLPPNGQATIALTNLGISDVVVKGEIVPVAGGLQGLLTLSGPAEGQIELSMVEGVQKIGLNVDLGGAKFAGSPAITVNRGTVRGDILLRPGAVSITASAQGRGLRIGSLVVGRFAAAANLVNGEGTATLSMSGQNGRLFDIQGRAGIAQDRIRIDLQGSVDQRPLKLDRAAVLTREDEGWRLAPVTLHMQGGGLRLAGLLGATATHVEAQMQSLPLALLDLVNGELGLGGTADGTLAFDWPRGTVPSGRMNLRIKGLTRSGLALSSAPIDIGLNAMLDSQRLAARAVFAKGGTVIGRAQALVAPLGTGSLADRVLNAPLRAQLRYAGDADTLWRLTNVEIISLGGDVRLIANATGTLSDPLILGSLDTSNARLQSPVTGMSLTNVSAHGTFSGSRLSIGDIQGRTAGNGAVAGSAIFDLSAERGVGMDINLRAERAVLLDRDDVGATVTGPLRIQSSGSGGVISGDLDVVASRFVLGRASVAAEIPQLRLVEINRAGDEVERNRAAASWRLDVKARAPQGLMVEGLGMQSEWSADLTIGGLVTAPAFRGTATLIRGTYDFAGKRFDLREGRLTFNGSTPVNPVLDVRAVADVQDLSATITVTGTSQRPIINFSSIPAMAQDELLARLLFGTSISKLSAPEALQLASAVAAFQGGGGGLDPINAVRRATGLSRLRVLAADPTIGQKTAIAAGKNIGRNLYVELITDGQGYSATRVEYQITRWLSLLSTVSTVGRQSAAARISKDY
ncbi:translocation/assembly module TamB domain-containing protein [Sphingobium nicotianae]|uniref:Translocation/assembly module TamB domain-containing protein n=1 Tax=Sphingobium nicotianae TaxID=2782607 RepID=A0A9X1DCM9_9SPHN|nr:translocation/assembly module TamB domain-containing protein [Sphingobium nicotianae]MBT2187434.1 translocation/assembly module TamB domain-containing protein [Sphingobium nicotianae]